MSHIDIPTFDKLQKKQAQTTVSDEGELEEAGEISWRDELLTTLFQTRK